MIQVYCDNEAGVNKWLRDNPSVKVIDIQMSLNEQGEMIMIIYKEEEEPVVIKPIF